MELPKEEKLHGKVLSGSMQKELEVLVRILASEHPPFLEISGFSAILTLPIANSAGVCRIILFSS